jgi:sugar (pentulose or hexulose) kinase
VAVRSLAGVADSVEVLAVACVGQGPTVVALDGVGEPVRPAITWQDRRPSGRGFGLVPRMAWLAASDADAVARSAWLLSSWDAAGLWLSGEAAWTLQDHERAPSDEELGAAGVRASLVPASLPFGARLGSLRPAAATELGLPAGIPVVAGVNDGTASMLGAGLLRPGDAVDTGGTSGGLGIYADAPVEVPGLFLAPAPLAGRWVVGGAMAALGSSVDWLRGPILGGLTIDELQVAAADVPPGAGGLVFLPYLAGERAPLFDDAARGAFFGLTLAHDARHLARAALEGTAFAMRSVAEPLAAAGAPIRELRLTGRPGGGDTWARIKADVLGVPVAIPAVGDTAVLGAAILAATGVGAVASMEAGVESMTSVARRVEPDPANAATYDSAYAVYRGLYPALRDA